MEEEPSENKQKYAQFNEETDQLKSGKSKCFFKIRMDYRNVHLIFTIILIAICLLVRLQYIANSHIKYYQLIYIQDENAKCLDGTNVPYYLYKGDPSKVLIIFQGGGWCGKLDTNSYDSLQSCYLRSSQYFGTSKKQSPMKMPKQQGSGIFMNSNNNYFANWTKIALKYCDGSGFQGRRQEPLSYKGKDLYFRGQDIAKAMFEQVNRNHKIFTNQVTHLVLSGISAGGLAASLWANYVSDRIQNSTKFWLLVDSGLFLDQENANSKQYEYRSMIQNLMQLVNVEIQTPIEECNKAFPTQLWKCMLLQHNYKFIRAPIFLAQSLYDSWSMSFIVVSIPCYKSYFFDLQPCNQAENQNIIVHAKNARNVIKQITKIPKNGAWAPACVYHIFFRQDDYNSQRFKVPAQIGLTLDRSIQQWMENEGNNSHIDQVNWPQNAPCS